MIFSIEEFAVRDGPGPRVTVFFKGCPLRCKWCHNPEGLSGAPEIVRNPNGCLACGACRAVCPSPEKCRLCGRCAEVCPRRLIRVAGQWYEPEELAARVLRNERVLNLTGGGVTLTGGEVFFQPEFLLETLALLKPVHRAIETSGYADPDAFREALGRLEFAYFDVKVVDPDEHKRYTGASNEKILKNLETLKRSGLPFAARVPLIEGVNDSDANVDAAARLLAGCASLQGVELLKYNDLAGAKYAMVGRAYRESFRAPDDARVREIVRRFAARGVVARAV